MGFFSELKEDLSQAVNELMPEEANEMPKEQTEDVELATLEAELQALESTEDIAEVTVENPVFDDDLSLEEMLKNIDAIQIPEEGLNTVDADAAAALVEESFAEAAQEEVATEDIDLESMLENALAADKVYTEEKAVESKGADKKMESYVSRAVSDETSIITAGMVITGDINSEGSMEVIGTINGNIEILGKLNVTGYINGNSKSCEIYAEGAKINGEVVSDGAVKIGASSVVIGNITAASAVIAGAVKGDIDVKGPVILDASAIVMGNIKSKSVQINNGAVIEGMCSQCYADVSPTSFFDDYKPEIRKVKNK